MRDKIALFRKIELVLPLLFIFGFFSIFFVMAIDINISDNSSANITLTNESYNFSEINNTIINETIIQINNSDEINQTSEANLTEENNKSDIIVPQTLISESLLGVQDYVDNGSLFQNVNDCGILNTSNAIYTLTGNVTGNGTCFSIRANNITLDGAGFMANYSANGTVGYGVNITNYNSTTIKNLIIKEGVATGVGKVALYASNAKNLSILNNNITTVGNGLAYGISLNAGSNYAFLYNNTINTTGPSGFGIYVTSTNYTNITSNNISNSNTVYGSGTDIMNPGIYLSSSSYDYLSNNRVNSSKSNSYLIYGSAVAIHYNHTIDSSNLAEGKPINYTFNADNLTYNGVDFTQYGQVLFVYSRNITIRNSNFSDDSLNLFMVNDSLIENNSIITSNGFGIYAKRDVFNSTIRNNLINISTPLGIGIAFENTNLNSTIDRNVVNGTGSGQMLAFVYGVSNSSFVNNTFTSNSTLTWGPYFLSSSYSNVSGNNVSFSGGGNYGIFMYSLVNSNVSRNSVYCSASCTGMAIQSSGSPIFNDSIEDNLINITGQGNATNFYLNPSNITYSRNRIFLANGYVFVLATNSNNMNFTMIDNVFNGSSSTVEFFIPSQINLGIWNLTNVTRYDGSPIRVYWSAGANGTLNNFWYADITLNKSAGNAYNGVNVSGWNVNNTLYFTNLSNSDGNITRQILLEYVRNGTAGATTTYYSNYTINATKNGATSASQSVNMSTNRAITFSLPDSSQSVNFINPSPRQNGVSPTNITLNVSVSDANNQTYAFINDGLVAWYRFNNESGENSTFFKDYSGLGNNATCSGASCPVWNASGKFNSAFRFNSSGSYSKITTATLSNHLSVDGNITLGFWVNFAGWSSMSPIVSPAGVPCNYLSMTGLCIAQSSGYNNAIRVTIRNSSDYTNTLNYPSAGYPGSLNQWIFITVVKNSSHFSIYANGTYYNSTAYTLTNVTLNKSYTIGGSSEPTYIFGGLIDEFIIFNRSLSSAEIQALYNSSQYYLQRNYTNLSGNQNISVASVDDAGNVNISSLIFNADATLPSVNFTGATPSNGSYQNYNYSIVNVSSSDNNNEHYSYVDFDSSLVGSWRLEQGNGTFFVDDLGRNNATCGTCPTFNSSGKFGGTYTFNGSLSHRVSTSNSSLTDIRQNITISFWLFRTGGSSGYSASYVLSKDSSAQGFLGYGAMIDGCYFVNNSGSSFTVTNSTAASSLVWQHHVCIKNGSNLTYYINGNLVKNTTMVGDIGNNTNVLTFGTRADGYPGASSTSFKGNLDEVMIFNRSLSSTEVLALYNSSANKYYNNFTNLSVGSHNFTAYSVDIAGNRNSSETRTFTIDTSAPSANLTSPGNNSYISSGSNINFTANLADNNGVRNATLRIFNSTGQIFSSVVNFTGNTISAIVGVVTSLAEGVYTWFYEIFDLAGNSYATVNNTLIIDETYPQISFIDPTPANASGASGSFIINASIHDTNLANISLNWDGSISVFEIGNSSLTDLGNGDYILTYNQTGLTIGQSYYYNLSIADLAGNSNSTETRIIFGNSPPTINNFVYSPSDLNVLDPGVNVYVNTSITDADNNLGSVVLQWKNSTSGWFNLTMNNLSEYNYTTNFTSNITLNSEENYSLRILANDTQGEENTSNIETVLVYWDCTWNYTYSGLAGSDAFGFSEDKKIGNVTLINNGDVEYPNNCSLSFSVSDQGFNGFSLDYWVNVLQQPDVSIKGLSFNTSTNVSAGQNRTFNVSAGFPSVSSPLEEDPIITFESSVNDTIYHRDSENITLAITVAQPGAYLRKPAFVAQPDSSIYLTNQTINLSAYTQNMGGDNTDNNSAYNVTLNWTLPSDISVYSGNSSNSFDEIRNSSEYKYNNISFIFSSSTLSTMQTGVHRICANTYGYENLSGNLSLIVHANNNTVLSNCMNLTFLCYNVSDGISVPKCGNLDGDYVAPTTSSSGGGGGGGGGAAATIQTKSDYTIVRGKQNEIIVPIINKYSNETLTNLKFSVSGNIAKYISIEPAILYQLTSGETENITLKISSPTYIELGQQQIVLKIEGQSGVKEYLENRIILLQVNALPADEAERLFDESQKLLDQLYLLNLSSEELNNLLNGSKLALNNLEYEKVQENYDIIKKDVESAVEAYKILSELEILINQYNEKGIDTSKSQRLLKLAKLSLERGEFQEAYARAKEAQVAFALEVKGEIGKLSYYLKNNTKEISFGLGALALIIFFSYKVGRIQILKARIKKLRNEEFILTELIKVVQSRTFKEKKMDMDEYRESMIQYEKKLAKIIEEIIDLETEVAHVLKFSSMESKLTSEKARITELVKQIQTDYLKTGKIEARVYESKLESYNRRLGEIESKLAEMEAKDAMKSVKRLKTHL